MGLHNFNTEGSYLKFTAQSRAEKFATRQAAFLINLNSFEHYWPDLIITFKPSHWDISSATYQQYLLGEIPLFPNLIFRICKKPRTLTLRNFSSS
jgi:hypothetical protein